MDEIVFHFNQRLEYFQIWLGEIIQRLSLLVESGLSSEYVRVLVASIKNILSRAFQTSVSAVSALAYRQDVALKAILGLTWAPTGLNKTSIVAGAVGFTLGSGLGIALGLSGFLYYPPPTRPVTLMKAIAATSFTQGTDSVTLLEDAVVPTVTKPDQVLVLVKASSLDKVDFMICKGYSRFFRRFFTKSNEQVSWSGGASTGSTDLPVVLGRDGSGVVVDLGRGVSGLDVGDAVYFLSPPWLQGTLSEYVLLPEAFVARKPSRMTFEGAASLPYSGSLAWSAIVRGAGLTPGNASEKRVLVHSACSGCGWALVQLLCDIGVKSVVATSWNRWAKKLLALGVTEVVPLENDNAERSLKERERFDIVFNTAGPNASEFCSSLVKTGRGAHSMKKKKTNNEPRDNNIGTSRADVGQANRTKEENGFVVPVYQQDLKTDGFGPLAGAFYSVWYTTRKLFSRERQKKGSSSYPSTIGEALCLGWKSKRREEIEDPGSRSTIKEVLIELRKLSEGGRLTPVIERAFDPEDYGRAIVQTKHLLAFGKTIVRFNRGPSSSSLPDRALSFRQGSMDRFVT